MADGFVLEIPEMVGIPLSPKRSPQAAIGSWPEGTLIISADSHMLETDLWVDRFPEHLKDQAPRMEFVDGGWRMRRRRPADDPAAAGGRPMHDAGMRARHDQHRSAPRRSRHRGRGEGADLPAAPVRAVHVRRDDEPARDLCGLQRAHRRGLQGGEGSFVPGDGPQLLGHVRRPRHGGSLPGPRRPLPDGSDQAGQGRRRRADPVQRSQARSAVGRHRPVGHSARLPHRRGHPLRGPRRGRNLRAHPDAGFSPHLGPAYLRRRLRPLSEAEGGVRRRRHLLGGVDDPRRRHDLQFVPDGYEPQAGPSAELVLVQPLLRDLHDRSGRPGAPAPHRP